MSAIEWNFVKASLPDKPRSVKRVDDRGVINGNFLLYALASRVFLWLLVN